MRLTRFDSYAENYYEDSEFNTSLDIPTSSFVNGFYLLPATMTTSPTDGYGFCYYSWWSQAIDANGNLLSQAQEVSWGYNYSQDNSGSPQWNWAMPPYFDGRVQLKQNLTFALRAAVTDNPFEYNILWSGRADLVSYPANYIYAGFYGNDQNNLGIFNALQPFVDNYRYRNFAFDSSALNGYGMLTLGVGLYSGYSWYLFADSAAFQFAPPAANGTAITALLGASQTRWLQSYPYEDISEIGLNYDGSSGTTYMNYNAKNLYGLPFLSTEIAGGNGNSDQLTLYPGYSTTASGYLYPEVAQPQYQTVGVEYDFWEGSPYGLFGGPPVGGSSPLPGTMGFSTSQTSDLLIAPVGTPVQVNGFAKLAVQNGNPGVYAYLGQYFAQAYQADGNGNPTANTTGILSPYGTFFATVPGPAALVTMPDVDTGQQGTAVVNCISLNVDKNHDGTMDLTFNGPDATSQASPMVFWVNNNFDRWSYDLLSSAEEQDDVLSGASDGQNLDPNDPDCNYAPNGNRAIPDTRDLEDFTRLWISGVTPNLLASLPPNSTVTLSWNDVGFPDSSNPTIDLFTATDADGGVGYLTDETKAAAQLNANQGRYVGRLGPGQSLQLNASYFGGTWRGNHFIWCGVNPGAGALTLTIADGSGKLLAQTEVYIQIKDIKDMYERWTVGDDSTIAPLTAAVNAANDLPTGEQPFQYQAPQNPNTPYILHVHGFNMHKWEKDRYAETEFKRLYWQGYQGRFGEFRWPTTIQNWWDGRAFDNSESNAWASGVGLLNLLKTLNTEYPDNVYLTAHSHGNVVVGEALRQATQQGLGQLVNTYIAMQAALDSHTYDPTTLPRPGSFSTPDRYGQYYVNGAPNYFNGSAAAGTYVNFFNPQDFALSLLVWQLDENVKWDVGYGYSDLHDNWWKIGLLGNTPLDFPQDTYTIFSYCDQAHAYALGAQADVGGAFSISQQVNLPDVWPPDIGGYKAHLWHSAEFRSDNAQRWQFWNQVLVKMKLESQ